MSYFGSAAKAAVLSLILGLALVAPAHAGPVNVNSADAETLAAELEGVGITKARAIVAYRNANGPFTTVESLAEATGIGERTVSINRNNILLGDDESVAETSR